MIWAIAGAPRIGKSILAKELGKKIHQSVISTDAIRWGIKQLNQIPQSDALFTLDNLGEETDTKNFYSNNSVENILRYQNLESREVVKVVKGFIQNCIEYQKVSIILEGVALLPSLIGKAFIDKYSVNLICVGNTDFASLLDYSWNHRGEGDWLAHVDKETFAKVIEYCTEFSKRFQNEAEEYHIPYYEISSQHFFSHVEKIISHLQQSGK